VAPHEHLQWLDDNVSWFEAIPKESFNVDVANCPGWDVEDVLTHLAYGLGLGYPYALSASPDADAALVWSDVPWPEQLPSGAAAMEAFSTHLRRCLTTFRSTDPDLPCWTYEGPGHARFWFRRAAIETTLHRMDVADALALAPTPLPLDRVEDAVAETIDFALPLAATIVGTQAPSVKINVEGLDRPLILGGGDVRSELSGRGDDVLAALWGRHRDRVEIHGDPEVAQVWMSLITEAFAGR
jgi:uncharacterized protein (TIGR03083 family)